MTPFPPKSRRELRLPGSPFPSPEARRKDKPSLLKLPGFAIEKELGRGGFGAVYQARRERDGSRLAIKVMLSQVAATEDAVLRFQREMEVNRQLDHPNIVRFLESGSHAGAFYFVMELCDGGSLMDRYQKNRNPLTPGQLMPLVLQALEGLAFAHSKGFVHRDLKPDTPIPQTIDIIPQTNRRHTSSSHGAPRLTAHGQ